MGFVDLYLIPIFLSISLEVVGRLSRANRQKLAELEKEDDDEDLASGVDEAQDVVEAPDVDEAPNVDEAQDVEPAVNVAGPAMDVGNLDDFGSVVLTQESAAEAVIEQPVVVAEQVVAEASSQESAASQESAKEVEPPAEEVEQTGPEEIDIPQTQDNVGNGSLELRFANERRHHENLISKILNRTRTLRSMRSESRIEPSQGKL